MFKKGFGQLKNFKAFEIYLFGLVNVYKRVLFSLDYKVKKLRKHK